MSITCSLDALSSSSLLPCLILELLRTFKKAVISANLHDQTAFFNCSHLLIPQIHSNGSPPEMSPGTDQTANLPPTSHLTCKKEIGTSTLHEDQPRRSPSWSYHHSRQSSNPFFLSRRAREQGNLVRDKRRERKSGTADDTLNDPEVRDRTGLAAKPEVLDIGGISEEVASGRFVGDRRKSVSPPKRTNQAQTNAPEKNGTPRSTDPGVGKTLERSPNEKTFFCIPNNSLPKIDLAAPTHPANSPLHSATLLDDHLLNYNRVRKEGTVRRRKIMRTVSQEDYLLARGANPRTGIVTPSIHSGSSSIDDHDLSNIREMSQNAQWRLKGDQWVSLGFDEPIPLPSSPQQLNDRRPGRLLRIPPKLAHGSRTRQGSHVHEFERYGTGGLTAEADNMRRLYQTGEQNGRAPSGPGARRDHVQATALPTRLFPNEHDRSRNDTVIKRKPLGTPPSKPSVEKLFQRNFLPEASTETVITKPGPEGQVRSSSMPTPRKIRFFRPEDVGKALPALPCLHANKLGNAQEESQPQTLPFLGLRPGSWIEDISNRFNLNGHDPEKQLPCPPTNVIQSRSPHQERMNIRGMSATTIPLHTNKGSNQRRMVKFPLHTEGRSSAFPHSRPVIPLSHYQMAQPTHTEQRVEQRTPTKDPRVSQPKPHQKRSPGHSKSLDPQTTMRSKGAEPRSIPPTKPSTTTPTTTPMTTTIRPLPEDVLLPSSWREIPSPLRPSRQRHQLATARPVMPESAEGTHNVPQVSPLKELPEERYQWRMAGMSKESGEIPANTPSTPEASPECDLIPRPLRPTNGNTAAAAGLSATTSIDHLPMTMTRKCPSCLNSFAAGARRANKAGFIRTRGDHLAVVEREGENVDPQQVDLSVTSGFLQGPTGTDIPDDHSRCCPECCAVGCHGSCLGHRSPPSRNGTSSGLADGTKAAFRNSMRLSRRIRVRTSAGGSRETETEEVAELETPMDSWETEVGGPDCLGLPPSVMAPREFWGGGGGGGSGGGSVKDGGGGRRVASNASASSVKTVEMPTTASVGAIVEAIIVPFGALRMWVKKHPQLLSLMQVVVLKLLEMSRHVLDTIGKAYRVAYIYSKTGKISAGKHASLAGFVRDCGKAAVYCLVLGAVGMMVGRVLAVFVGVGGWLIWCLGWVGWVVKVGGLGVLW